MCTRKKTTQTRIRRIALVALGICLGFASNAAANTGRLPAAYTSLVSYHEVEDPKAATREAGKMMAAESRVGRRRDALHGRYRRIKILSFSRAVEVGREDVIVKVQSPGRRKSIMMVELKF